MLVISSNALVRHEEVAKPLRRLQLLSPELRLRLGVLVAKLQVQAALHRRRLARESLLPSPRERIESGRVPREKKKRKASTREGGSRARSDQIPNLVILPLPVRRTHGARAISSQQGDGGCIFFFLTQHTTDNNEHGSRARPQNNRNANQAQTKGTPSPHHRNRKRDETRRDETIKNSLFLQTPNKHAKTTDPSKKKKTPVTLCPSGCCTTGVVTAGLANAAGPGPAGGDGASDLPPPTAAAAPFCDVPVAAPPASPGTAPLLLSVSAARYPPPRGTVACAAAPLAGWFPVPLGVERRGTAAESGAGGAWDHAVVVACPLEGDSAWAEVGEPVPPAGKNKIKIESRSARNEILHATQAVRDDKEGRGLQWRGLCADARVHGEMSFNNE